MFYDCTYLIYFMTYFDSRSVSVIRLQFFTLIDEIKTGTCRSARLLQ